MKKNLKKLQKLKSVEMNLANLPHYDFDKKLNSISELIKND